MKGIQGPGMLSAADILLAPIHVGLVTGGRFKADMRGDGMQRPQPPDQPLHNGIRAGEAVMSAQVAIDAGGPQPWRPDQPLCNQRAKGRTVGRLGGAMVRQRWRPPVRPATASSR
jgi:hypothetical protein